MVRACGSYPQCPEFESLHRHHQKRPRRCPVGAFLFLVLYSTAQSGYAPHYGRNHMARSTQSPFGKGGFRGICLGCNMKSPLAPLCQRGGIHEAKAFIGAKWIDRLMQRRVSRREQWGLFPLRLSVSASMLFTFRGLLYFSFLCRQEKVQCSSVLNRLFAIAD